MSDKPKRILLKISGQSFCRAGETGIHMEEITSICSQIKRVVDQGVQLAIVCGGGNILRGKEFAAVSASIKTPTAHYMGMLATVINGLALQDALENAGVETRLQTAIQMEKVAEPSRSFAAAAFGTWKRAESSSSRPEPAARL